MDRTIVNYAQLQGNDYSAKNDNVFITSFLVEVVVVVADMVGAVVLLV